MPRPSRLHLAALALPLCLCLPGARSAQAASAGEAGATVTLDLPVYEPEAGLRQVPAYAARRFQVRLAEAARPPRGSSPRGVTRTGHAGVDRLLDRFAVPTLEPMFPGATPPAPGSGEPDLTAYYIVHLPPGAGLPEALGAFRQEPAVEDAEPIGVFPVQVIPDDSLFAQQYAFSQPSDHDADLPEAWELTQGDSATVVAIVDTGVLWTHPDLGGPAPHTGGSIWHNWAEVGGVPGVDDDGNGYVDDVRGWDFVAGKYGRAGEDVDVPDNDPSDFVGHGTFVAGVAGAIADNGSGVAGAGWRARILPLRVGWDDGVGAGGVVDMAFCAQAIYYAAQAGAAAINCSWNNGNLSGLGAAVSYALARGSTVVVAAGNQGTSTPPANYLATRGDCVDVAALDEGDLLTNFSNYGAWVDVSAGGRSIRSTTSVRYAPGYGLEDGTSFAAPLVSGVVALYQSWRKAQGLPPARPSEVLWRLHDTADPVDLLNPGYEGLLGGGRVNALRMIQDPPTSFLATLEDPVPAAPAFLDWGAADAVVVATQSGGVWALDAVSGEALAGWPLYLDGEVRTAPAAWDVDLDGAPEAVVAVGGRVHALRASGASAAGWPAAVGGTVVGGPAIGNVAGDPAFEIVVLTAGPDALHVLDRHGDPVPGWPRALAAPSRSTPALADLDADGLAEIVFAGEDSTVHVVRGDGTPHGGWPVKVGAALGSAPAVGDLDEDGVRDIVVGGEDGLLHAWSAAGAALAGWPVSLGAAVRSGPALADVDGDLHLEAVAGTDAGALHVRRADGTPALGWPVGLGAPLAGSPALGDLDHDGSMEVVVGGADGRVQARRADGSALPGWPRVTGGAVSGGGSLGDPDGDGRLELAIGAADGVLRCWDLGPGTHDPTRLPWPTEGRSFLRQGSVVVPAIEVSGPAADKALRLAITPNPARGIARARLAAVGQGGAGASLSVFDAAGRLVRSERGPLDGRGFATWKLFDVREGERMRAGLYFVEARVGGAVARAKWIVLP